MFKRRFCLWASVLLSLLPVHSEADSFIFDLIKWPPGAVPSGQTNGPDTLDDIWQGKYNAWGIDPNGDEDNDGCKNIVEAIAGTNPFQANDCFKIGNMTVSGSAVIFTAKVEAGKKYRILSSNGPDGPTWDPETLQTPVSGVTEYVPSADQAEAFISIQKPGNTKKFYKLETSDVDSNNDGVSDWVARELGLNPDITDSNGDGVSDFEELTQEVQTQDEVTLKAENAFTSEDGGQQGVLRLRRNHALLGATIFYTVGGTASAGSDFTPLSGSVYFAPGAREATVAITANQDSNLEGGESVTVSLTGGMTDGNAPLQITGQAQASVIISNTTAPGGTGLLARYYDHASGTYDHAANFGDLGNYAFTRGTPTTTGSIVVTPTTGDTPTLLAALSIGDSVRLSFNGGNLNSGLYNHQNYTVTAKTGTTFTCSITSAATLPSSSSSTCYFSVQSFPHPARITRVDPTVDYEWMGGTPNGNSLSPNNSPDNWSSVWEGYLHPTSTGNYRLQLDADDKARVLVDLDRNGTFDLPGEQVLEHGWDTAATGSPEDGVADDETIGTFKISSSFALAASSGASTRYRTRVELVETTGEARCRLQWSVNNGTFANIPQSNIFSHVASMNANYSYTRISSTAGAMTGTILVTLNGHGLSVSDPVELSFSSGNLFTPANGNFHGSYTVAAVNSTNTFTVNIAAPTLPASGTGAGYVLNRPTTTSPINAWYNVVWQNTDFSDAPARVGTNNNGTNDSNNGLYGVGSPDPSIIALDSFSVRWTGQVQPQFSEEYTFSVIADDGCRMKINGEVQDLKMMPSANSGGSTYVYDSATGTAIVNYSNSVLKMGNVAVGEKLRLDPANGNLSLGNNSTYTYDSASGDLVVNYSNLTNVTPGSFALGETVEVDPTSGTVNLGLLPYEITAATANTFTVNIGAGVFDSGSGNINVSDNGDRIVTAVYASGTGTYSYTSTTGDAVVDYSGLGLPANLFQTGQSVPLDPNSGNLSGRPFEYKQITANTASTFTVNYGTGFTTGTGSIIMVATGGGAVPADKTAAFAVQFGAGKFADGSTGTMNFNFVNKSFKDWGSNGNERYVRIPMVGGARYDIELEYWESSGFSRSRLFWFSPSQPKQIIPTERLYPAHDLVLAPAAPASHTSPTDATALVGGAFGYVLQDSNGAAVSLDGLPAWLTYSNGVISGTPPAGTAGDYQILITLTNAAGTSTSLLNLHVEDTGGGVEREFWNGIPGTSVAAIPTSTAPTGTATLSSLEAPTDFGDDYGARIRGHITAPATGNYYFWLAASSAAELWISDDEESVNAFKRAAVVNGSTTPRTWNSEAGQKSPWLALEQGRKYYFEVLHKAGTGAGDNLAIGWARPGESVNAPSEIVPGYVLSAYVPPAPGSIPGTLYVATMLSQNGAATSGVGSSTMRLSEDETTVHMTYSYSGLSGPITAQHIHVDPYLSFPSTIVYDIDTPANPSDGLQPDGSHKWTIEPVGALSAADIVEIIKQGKAYINLHTATYPDGEIRGNYTLANGTRTFTPPPPPPAWTDDHTTDVGAVRFLTQATFGPNAGDIAALKAMPGYEAWIDDQFTKPASLQLPEVIRTEFANAQGGAFDESLTFNAWWWRSVTGNDQLRQRIAFALSEIHVVSSQGPLDNNARALSYFYDKLAQNAFGNFRDILVDTTLTPSMGRYLDMLRNDKPDQTVGRIPNENYAREIKQLFSIGLYRMWPDGSLILDSKESPIDTYTQREIVGLSHVFTGWDYGYDGAPRTALNAPADWTRQMREVPARHFTGPKRIINNVVLPGLDNVGGQPLDPYANHISAQYNDPSYQALPGQELAQAHDLLFNHPNVGPFICRQLIQRLITSHPSRDYLYRVVQKFNDNGSGVRGDMKAVIKAILLDFEARSGIEASKPSFGKQREPVLRVTAAARAFRKDGWTGTYTQNGNRTITITTSTPHGYSATSNQFLNFTSGSPAPWTGVYSGSVTNSTTLTVQAQGWATGTYSIPANSTTCTVSMTNHWLGVGNQFFIDFTSGGANGTSVDSQVYPVATVPSPTNSGNNGNSFTFTVVGTSASARTGNCMIPRFSPGSYTTASSGLPAPNDRRVTMDTNFDHHLNVGDQVQLNFYGGNPEPVDMVVTVESVVDLNTYTFLAPAAGTNLGTTQGFNAVYQFPLLSQPLVRSGTVDSRPSTFNMGNTTLDLDQSPIASPTVFNFYLPDYKYPGALASQGITTPEFQNTAETTVVRQANFLYNGLFNPNQNTISSFKTGSNSLVLDLSPWMPADATNIGLGAPTNATLPWTHNQNIDALIDKLSTLLTAGQLSSSAKSIIRNFVALPIESIAVGSPCTVTTTVPHGYSTNDSVCVSGVTNGSFSTTVNNTTTARTVTVTGPTTFILTGVNCTSAPNASGLANAHVSPVIYNQGTTAPLDTNKRDRLRSIIHLILSSPDFTIQR